MNPDGLHILVRKWSGHDWIDQPAFLPCTSFRLIQAGDFLATPSATLSPTQVLVVQQEDRYATFQEIGTTPGALEANVGAADAGYRAALRPVSDTPFGFCNWQGLTEISSLKPWGRILISLKENIPDGHFSGAIVNLCKALLVNER